MPTVADLIHWGQVREHYDLRHSIHKQLLVLMKQGKRSKFAELLLGVSDPNGNYSAAEHGLGPWILSENTNAVNRVWILARQFRSLKTAHEVPRLIREASLGYLQVGVGSEASCMLNPRVCWVANVRTIWTHLLLKHADFQKADIELRLYRDADSASEMTHAIWTGLHSELETSMTNIAKEGGGLAREAGVAAGSSTYLWADCIANALYAGYFMRTGQEPISVGNPVDEEVEEEWGLKDFNIDRQVDPQGQSPFELMTKLNLREQEGQVLKTLTRMEEKVLRLRFGLQCEREHTLEEIGQEFGLTRERIRQVEAEALHKLRQPSRRQRLREFLGDSPKA